MGRKRKGFKINRWSDGGDCGKVGLELCPIVPPKGAFPIRSRPEQNRPLTRARAKRERERGYVPKVERFGFRRESPLRDIKLSGLRDIKLSGERVPVVKLVDIMKGCSSCNVKTCPSPVIFPTLKPPLRRLQEEETKDSLLKSNDSPRKSKDSPLKSKESPLKSKDSPLKSKYSPRKSKDSPLKSKYSPRKSKDISAPPSPCRSIQLLRSLSPTNFEAPLGYKPLGGYRRLQAAIELAYMHLDEDDDEEEVSLDELGNGARWNFFSKELRGEAQASVKYKDPNEYFKLDKAIAHVKLQDDVKLQDELTWLVEDDEELELYT